MALIDMAVSKVWRTEDRCLDVSKRNMIKFISNSRSHILPPNAEQKFDKNI